MKRSSSIQSIDKFSMVQILNESVKSNNEEKPNFGSLKKVNFQNQNKNQAGKKPVAQMFNGPTEKTFIKYYEQNIKLKKELQDKKNYIQDLKKKLQQQMNMNKTAHPYAEYSQLKLQTKKKGPPPRAQSSNKKGGKAFYNTMTGNGQTKKVQNLLQIIDHYKGKLLLAQQQAANLRQQKYLLQQDISIKQRPRNDSNLKDKNFKPQEQLALKLKQKTGEYEIQKQRNNYMEAQIRRMQSKVRTLENNKDQVEDLKIQYRISEERLMKLTLLNDTSEGFDRRAIEDKAKQLELKLKSTVQKYNRLKDQKMKLQTDIQFQSNKLIELQYDKQQLQKQNLKLKKNQINDPVIQKLIKNKQLLAKVVGQIQNPKGLLGQQSLQPYQTAHKLILQKQHLAKTLIDAQNKMKSMEQAWKEKQTLNQIEKEEFVSKLNMLPVKETNARYTSNQGVPYDGDISMFSDQKIGQATGVNFFDIYLGQVNLMETIVKSVAGLSNATNPSIIATVDFYNFETKHTKLTQGLVADFNTEFTFRIAQDDFFYKFMTKEKLKIDILASEGTKVYHLGTVQVPLKQLFLRNKPNVSPVVNTSAPILLAQKVVGTIHFDMRMRLPIFQQASKALNTSMLMTQNQPEAQKRKLIIQIQQGVGFSQKSNLFVYYPFRLQDFYTKTSKGPDPKWDHSKILQVAYNQEFKNYLKKNQLEFTLFDDNAVLYDDKDTDVVGTGSIQLMALADAVSATKGIRERLEIKKNGAKVGMIDVKVFWYETKDKNQAKQLKKQSDFIEALHVDIKKYISSRNTTFIDQFRRIDDNGTGFISFEQFQKWTTKVKQSHRYSQELISKYFDTFKQPLNLINWQNRLKQQSAEEKRPKDLMKQLGSINQFLQQNSFQIQQQVSLRDYMVGKQPLDVTLELDKDKNGIITRKQLMEYMKKKNIILDQNQIQGDQISILQFLRKYAQKPPIQQRPRYTNSTTKLSNRSLN